ncbi:hypothetical protein LCGC14_1567730 [marine sediment metagenome]|uniref:Uncharacterized protein n=1 Tax=marine sediment metagenome TaxID=412755 RepID=A0A0F9L1Q5_9ZZZZ
MSRFVQNFNGASLVYPNGGEIFNRRTITIQWIEPSNAATSSNLIWHEILFTELYDDLNQQEWSQIANISMGITSFDWSIPVYVKSNKCRVGIRSVNHKGERSAISYSANNFSIQDKNLPIPAVFEPVEGASYFSYVPIVLDNKGIIGQCSQRAFYQVYYSSEKQDVDWTLISGNIPVGSEPIYWDIRELRSSPDYSVKVEIVDEDSVSEPVFINNLQLNSLNYFLIDTKPPTGKIEITNNREYTNERNAILKISAYDETTEAKLFRIEQKDIFSGNLTLGSYQNLSEFSTWYVSGNDGIKLIQVRFKDYAGNILLDGSQNEFFRTYKSLDNREITSFVSKKNGSEIDLWIAFGGSSYLLYLNQNQVAILTGECTSLIIYNDVLYIGIKTIENKGILQKYSGGQITTLKEFDDVDSVINSMEVFDDKLFIGLDNGKLLSFNGSFLSTDPSYEC